MKMKGPYVRESDRLIKIGNDLVELGFDAKRKGALVSLVDRKSGYQFQRDQEVPKTLFRLALRRKKDRRLDWLDSREAGKFRWQKSKSSRSVTLRLELFAFPGRALKVEVEVTVAARSTPNGRQGLSALSLWRMRVSGLAEGEAVYQLTCPIIAGVMKVGDEAPGETLAVPRQGEGCLFRNPYPVVDRLPLKAGIGPDTPAVGMGEVHGRYPGQIPMQLMLYYNDHAGLYLAAHDPRQNVKSFDIGQMADWGQFPVMAISHFPSERMGKGVALDYDTIVGVFHGDWYDGADLYTTWARKQWWCEKKLRERDIPAWMRKGFGVFQVSNYHIPVLKRNHSLSQIADVVNRLSKEIGAPLLALIFNFEGGGAWTGPVGFFPPKEGDQAFKKAMKRLRHAGNYGFVYMPGGNWYIAISSYSPPFNSRPQFEAEGRPNAIMNDKGEVNIGKWYAGWESARLCPRTDYLKEMTASLLLGAVERGCPVVQIDNFPCGGADACYDPRHGHPLGYGPWWSQDWNRILADTRSRAKKLSRDVAITTEGISENFIPHLDMYDQRGGNMEYFGHWPTGGPMGGETIPFFGYVYNGYIGAYLAAYPECNRPEVLYWTRCLGKSLAHGVVPTGGHYLPEPAGLNPVTIGFYKKVVRAAAQECWKYIMFGEMLRPPKIDVPKITASYCKFILTEKAHYMDPNQRHEVQDRAVQHSAWRASDGAVGYIFVNVSEEPVTFGVELSPHSEKNRRYNVETVTDGKRAALLKNAVLPSRQKVSMSPLSVVLIEVIPSDER
jgi:hypothetical protein